MLRRLAAWLVSGADRIDAYERRRAEAEMERLALERERYMLTNELLAVGRNSADIYNELQARQAITHELIEEAFREMLDLIRDVLEDTTRLPAQNRELLLVIAGRLAQTDELRQTMVISERSGIKEQITSMTRYLQKQEQRAAKYGIDAPAWLEIEIDECKARISELKNRLQEYES